MEDATSSSRQQLWETFGRGTAAGRALFNLYSGDSAGRGAGSQYNDRNKIIHESKLARGWTPPAPGPEVQLSELKLPPKVSYPKFKKKTQETGSQLANIPRRKPAEVILRELEEDLQQMMTAPLPAPTGPLLDEKEKDRLAVLMQYRGKVPTANVEDIVKLKQKMPTKRSPQEELEERFTEVVHEIDERKQFLTDMQTAGALTKDHVRQIHAEIADRVRELGRLDGLIKRRE